MVARRTRYHSLQSHEYLLLSYHKASWPQRILKCHVPGIPIVTENGFNRQGFWFTAFLVNPTHESLRGILCDSSNWEWVISVDAIKHLIAPIPAFRSAKCLPHELLQFRNRQMVPGNRAKCFNGHGKVYWNCYLILHIANRILLCDECESWYLIDMCGLSSITFWEIWYLKPFVFILPYREVTNILFV